MRRGQDAAFLNGSKGLGNLFRRKNQGKAHIALSVRAETGARRAQYACLFEQVHAEVHRPGIMRGNGRPDKHTAFGVGNAPADCPRASAERIAALTVQPALLLDGIQGTGQCSNGCLLNGEEHAEIDLTAQPADGIDHIFAAEQEGNACTGDVKGLGK